MSNHAFSEAEQAAIYRAIFERRDVRRFVSGDVPDAVLNRLLTAAYHAPSVGYMQPSNFIIIRNDEVRKKIYAAFIEANNEAKNLFEGEKAEQYASLKLEGILDSSLNICITCDRTRFGDIGLGRTCQPDMDMFSSVCAVQNLWLAARGEGIAVGWVSIIKPDALKSILQLPENVVPVAYLCIGHTEKFASEPELKTHNWNPTVPLAELIFQNQWGTR